jgi:hypothetical protein
MKSKQETNEIFKEETGLDLNEAETPQEGREVAVSTNGNGNGNYLPMEAVDVTDGNLPDLDDATEFPLDLMADYWTPANLQESKRVFFDCIKIRAILDQTTGEVIELPCAYFFEKKGQDVKTISNGSKRLVGIFENGAIARGTPLLITYLGKKKGSKFYYDDWSVKPLILKK